MALLQEPIDCLCIVGGTSFDAALWVSESSTSCNMLGLSWLMGTLPGADAP